MSVSKPNISTLYRLSRNIKSWGRYSPTYIVIHFTGGFSETSDTLGGMMSSYKLFLQGGSNAHYLVGRDAIWEMVNPKSYYCTYSCGSSVGKVNACVIPGWGPSAYKGPLSMSHAALAGHTNTINVEICSCKSGRKTCDPMDDGWYFNDSTYLNAVKLCAWLCDEFSIKINNIIMHNQVTGKICPAMWCNREGAENGFNAFKQNVAAILNEVDEDTPVSPSPKPTGGTLRIAADTIFHSRPNANSPVVYVSKAESSMEYSIKNGDYYYTDNGWTQG